MPPARTATAQPRRASRTRPPARRRRSRWTIPPRVRWDRVGRVALLVVLAVVAGLYVQQGLAYLSVRSQANEQHAIVTHLLRQNRQLARQEQALNNRATIESDARALGMVRPGERPYAITGMGSTTSP